MNKKNTSRCADNKLFGDVSTTASMTACTIVGECSGLTRHNMHGHVWISRDTQNQANFIYDGQGEWGGWMSELGQGERCCACARMSIPLVLYADAHACCMRYVLCVCCVCCVCYVSVVCVLAV